MIKITQACVRVDFVRVETQQIQGCQVMKRILHASAPTIGFALLATSLFAHHGDAGRSKEASAA
jgi:hypothetical protein